MDDSDENAFSQSRFPPEAVARRFDQDFLERRLDVENRLLQRLSRYQNGTWNSQSHSAPYNLLIEKCFKLFGLYARGRRNYLDIQVVKREIAFSHLPEAFDGFRILQISDLHTGLEPALPDAVIKTLAGLEYDVCVNTGDYRNKTKFIRQQPLDDFARIAENITQPHLGILGNHDFISKIPELESTGLKILVNDSCLFVRDAATLAISGVDDCTFFQTHDVTQARQKVPPEAFSVLLSHSPDIYADAANAGYDLMLCGHTHGGQLCLPGAIPLLTHCNSPRIMASGTWRYREMQGYTSRGTGGGTTAVRFNCPPEITLHILRRCPGKQ